MDFHRNISLWADATMTRQACPGLALQRKAAGLSWLSMHAFVGKAGS
jgi:hypothetical protein